MYFNKIRHPSNFSFGTDYAEPHLQLGGTAVQVHLRSLGEDVFHLELGHPQRWPVDARVVHMLEDTFCRGQDDTYRLALMADGQLVLRDVTGQTVLAGRSGASLGACGAAWMVQLERTEDMRFYGQGEKTTGLEKTGRRTKFWNADVWADHAMSTIADGQADPQYAAVPYLLIRQGSHWIGILVDHPGAVFMDTGSNWYFDGRQDAEVPPAVWFGADQGVPAFYLIAGNSAASVTRRLQRLVGVTPLPPLWSLGHHQCRWGYGGVRDLQRLDAAFTAHAFPNDGLWLDIDYMDDYKVFTTNPALFGNLQADLKSVQDHGRKVVPILDPGVKVQTGYAVAQSGLDAGIFCLNPEGAPYVGFVWPGRTWFPDFSLSAGRDWWAGYARTFRESGFDGAWLDMNDPATGAAEVDDMRFQQGRWDHWTYHNIYGTGMAEATRAGFLQARPDERPFLLARSAAAGSSRYTAVWTGDNISNWHHLRTSIHCTLNLALSGIPFNGPDVPGFGGHADRELAIAWYKAGCLFPFFRNHANALTADQEPWAFGPAALAVIRHFVRLRYKLLPYTYQLWLQQAADGSAVMRPLFHDYESLDGLALDRIDDQFLIGADLMQAPLVHAGQQQRTVVLPGRQRWMDGGSGIFLDGGRVITANAGSDSTPMYLREGALIPMQPGERTSQHNDLSRIELHAILGRASRMSAQLDYTSDDGATYAFQRGARNVHRLRMERVENTLHLHITPLQQGWQPLTLQVVGYDGATTLQVHTAQGVSTHALNVAPWRCSGGLLDARISPPITA